MRMHSAASNDLLAQQCNASLVTYHKALTAWFSGASPSDTFNQFVDALSLSRDVVLQDRAGKRHTYDGLLKILRTLHGREPGTIHYSTDVEILSNFNDVVDLRFREIILPAHGVGHTVQTRATCSAAPLTVSHVKWGYFDERPVKAGESTRPSP